MDTEKMVGQPYLHFKGNIYTVLGFCNVDFGGNSDVLHVIYCDYIKRLQATDNLAFHTESLSAYNIDKDLTIPLSHFYKATREIGKYEEETDLTRECRSTFQHTWIRPLQSFTDILEDGTPRFKQCLNSKEYWKVFHIRNHSAPHTYQDHTYEEFPIYCEDDLNTEDNQLQVKINLFRNLFSEKGPGIYYLQNGSIRYLENTERNNYKTTSEQLFVNASYYNDYFDHPNDKNRVTVNKISTIDILKVLSHFNLWDTEKVNKHVAQIQFIQKWFEYQITVDDSRKFTYDTRNNVIANIPENILASLLRKFKIIL
jgi:hypothetical protein